MLCSKLDVASFLLPAYWVQTSLNLDHLLFLGSLPCLLCIRCLRDTCIPEDAMLKDPRRLYAPGRIYHIVERKMFRCGRYPPVVKTAVPVDGRFEHIVLSCNATMDHAIIWIEREAQKALDLMLEKEKTMEVPSEQRMERNESLQREHVEEHKAALRRAVTLSVPDARSPSAYGTFGEQPERSESFPPVSAMARQRMSWNDLIERVFDRDESGHIVLRSSPSP
ncbi:Os09g0569300 [Oryza sativa Japonica Group]|uniref:Os09g0569300 protein n=1 Tax=Oryza sativa subsp. japonica TaxID=39947 RepID=C7J6T1_ORYSJ|nr:Os09g0569300 [Oryza sativa Japonica Group]|eukprot:NP_001175992.1 Os09g0569300 [Oryza sativa Japonica Group]